MQRRRRPLLIILFLIALLAAVPLIMPWAFHIGGRWTPMLTWWGSGRLVTKSGAAYPIFVTIHPASHFSRLRLDGLRPTGGVGGSACLCLPSGEFQVLKLGGTIYGGWKSTEGALLEFRLLEPTVIDVGQKRAGYFDLYGRWQGQELVLDDRGRYSAVFRSGLRIQGASARLQWNPYWSCKSVCAHSESRP